MILTAKLFHPSTLIMVAANLVPLLGIFLWGWDAFLLLALYWMETAIIGFWTILAIAIAPVRMLGPSAEQASRWFLVPFFIVHSGIFMAVHFLFLWSLFSGDWAARIHNPIEFVRIIVIGAGLWVPFVALFISRGVSSLLLVIGPMILPSWLIAKPASAPITDTNPFSEQRLLGGFYKRIIIMHLTLIVGGGIAVALGSTGALVLMIALKIAIDLKLHLKSDFPNATPVAVTTV